MDDKAWAKHQKLADMFKAAYPDSAKKMVSIDPDLNPISEADWWAICFADNYKENEE